MTNAQILKDRIKSQCETQGKSISKMLSELELGVNAINQINEKKGIGSFVLLNIADYLEVSTDYLLGRTENKNGYTNKIVNNGNTTVKDNGIQANVVNNQIQQAQFDSTTIQVAEVFQSLNFTDKAKVINLLAELSQKEV